MAGKLRVVAGPPLRQALRAAGSEFPTGRLNAIAERYLAMVEDVRPAMHRNEWLAVCDANNGCGLDWQMIWANVADTPDLGAKWSIDQGALVKKLHAMTTTQKIAVTETIQRFWSYFDLPTSQALDLATSHPATWPPDTSPDKREETR
jgi:hypothetical protein